MNDEIRVVLFRDGDFFIAQGLEVDISAQGKTAEEAYERFGVVFDAELREARDTGRSIFDIGPAPLPFRALYEQNDVSRHIKKVA